MRSRLPILAALAALVLAAGCGSRKVEDAAGTTPLTMPDGSTIRVEVMMTPIDMMRGMMFRDEMGKDRGMLFVHDKPGVQHYWMYHVKIPLDMIFMDPDHRIVEIEANVPPCPPESKAKDCPSYGSAENVRFVLELAGGEAARRNLKVGDTLRF